MPFHTALGDGQIHRIYDQSYADDTARDADTTWNGDSDNIGKCVLVTGDNTIFMLLSTTPTWFEFGGSLSSAVTIYSNDSDISGNRVVTAPSGRTLELISYDLTSSNFTTGADVDLSSTEVDIEAFTGDGVGGTTATSRLLISTTTMQFLDQINSKGVVYGADYSANFTDRSLVDKGYVDSVALSQSNQLIDATERSLIGQNEADLLVQFYDTNSTNYQTRTWFETYYVGTGFNNGTIGFGRHEGDQLGTDTGTQSIVINYAAMEVTDSINSRGLEYASDYSANFTAQSLVDRNFIEGEDWTLTADKTVTLIPTTGVGLLLQSSTPTTGEVLEVRSTSTDTNERVVTEITNTQSAATGTMGLRVDNAADNYAAWLESGGDHALRIVGNDETSYETGFQIAQRHVSDMSYWDFSSVMGSGGTSGDFYFRYTNISDASLEIMHVNAVSQAAASITLGSATDSIVVDYGQDVSVQYTDRSLVDKGYVDGISLQESDITLAAQRTISSALTTTTPLIVDTDTTTADVLLLRGNDLTTGAVLRVYSNSASTSSRNLLYIHNDNALADDTYPLYIQNDAATLAAQFVTNSSATVCVGVTGGTVEYAADYSSDYSDRALVDKGYVAENAGFRTFLTCGRQSLSTSTSFNFGNESNNGAARIYVPTGFTCEVEALTFHSPSATTATLGIRKNGGSWLTAAAMSGTYNQTDTWTSGNSVSNNDYLDVRPTAVTTSGNNNTCVIVLKYTPT